MVIVAIDTEIRRGDSFNLTWERIDFQRGLIDVSNSKTGRDYSVPMNEDVKAVSREISHTSHGNGYVFINPDTAKPYTDIKTVFGTACQLVGIAWLQNFRRLVVRYERYAENFLGMLHLGTV